MIFFIIGLMFLKQDMNGQVEGMWKEEVMVSHA
jgi:hypothetical protein